ncbi:flavin monoamine oxidase family protein [Parvibium lacunae]|nr:FAD-dependent oxidoreductase [Parvibium lacunae]
MMSPRIEKAPGLAIDLSVKLDFKNAAATDYDVVIVGAGMSGLYTAWRLAQSWQQSPKLQKLAAARADNQLRIAILEWSDRVGGRIDSYILDGMTHVPAELGGMRFTTSHQVLMQVINMMNMATEPFPMTDNSQFLLRGKRMDEAAISNGTDIPPYGLTPPEQKQTPNQLFNYAISQICDYQQNWSDANWQWVKQNVTFSDAVYQNLNLYDIGFWNILYRVLSNEGYDYVWDGGGYNSNTINWNAAEAMPYMLTDFSQPTNFLRIPTGFHTLPAAMAAQLVNQLNVPIYGKCRVVRFDTDTSSGTTTVLVENTDDPSQRGTLTTQVLFLAMPRHSLELIDQDCDFFLNETVQYNIQAVIPQPAYKLFLAYSSRWWNPELFKAGPTITDQPLRMTYDFGTEAERGGDPNDQRVLLLASYADMQATSFWGVLERDTVFTSPPNWNQTGAEGGADATGTMTRMAQGMLQQVFVSPDNPNPTPTTLLAAHYQDWSQDPYGAGFHAWAAHYKAWEVMQNVRWPMRDRNIFICGEAYSNAQGWVEGAYCTAESILEEFFGLPRLTGVPADYPLLSPTPVEPGNYEANPTYRYKEMQYVY